MNTHTLPAELTTRTPTAERTYTAAFLTALTSGCGAWGREARVVIALAAQTGIALDEQTLVWSDVRDLQALRARLTEQRAA
ncbi:MAG: hypothetical protein OJF49_003440 [Ktedonobacterales bacterium]|jgi:hypothetical protein|nr:MAG: hypothetical protein OJF49_003440 [Ktedonobacterales bacterium]